MSSLPSRLSIEDADERVLAVAGVIDCHTADDLGERLQQLGTGADIRLDLAEIEFIDSSGLRTLVNAHQELAAGERRLVLHRPSEAVVRLLEITGLGDHLHVT